MSVTHKVKPHTPTPTPAKQTQKPVKRDYITEEQRVRLINDYPFLTQKDFEQKDGEKVEQVFSRIAKAVHMTDQKLYEYFHNK